MTQVNAPGRGKRSLWTPFLQGIANKGGIARAEPRQWGVELRSGAIYPKKKSAGTGWTRIAMGLT